MIRIRQFFHVFTRGRKPVAMVELIRNIYTSCSLGPNSDLGPEAVYPELFLCYCSKLRKKFRCTSLKQSPQSAFCIFPIYYLAIRPTALQPTFERLPPILLGFVKIRFYDVGLLSAIRKTERLLRRLASPHQLARQGKLYQ